MNQPWILIVDDDENICKLLTATLTLWNINAESVTNPLLAVDEIKRKAYSVIFLDVFMPEMNGMELLVDIRKNCPDTKVIIITGYGDKEVAIKALNMGAFDFLEKPIALDLLFHTVKRALDIQKTEKAHRKTLKEFGNKSQELIETIEALSVVMKHIETAKQEMAKMITMQFKSFLAPIIKNLQNERDAKLYESQLAMLSSYIESLNGDLPTDPPANTTLSSLSYRELQIALMIKNDMTNEDIAARLHISPETVRTHRRNIRKKLGMRGTKARLNTQLWALEGSALGVDMAEQIAHTRRHENPMDSSTPPD